VSWIAWFAVLCRRVLWDSSHASSRDRPATAVLKHIRKFRAQHIKTVLF
jgi:hypothetical protein